MSEAPFLRVVRGDLTAEELAALLAVLTARTASTEARGSTGRSAWNDPARLVRRPVASGPGGWVASARLV